MLEAVKVWSGKAEACRKVVRQRDLEIKSRNRRRRRCAVLANSLTKKVPYKGPGADSEEKHEPVSDIEPAAVDSLKALDPKRPIREATEERTSLYVGFVPCVDGSELARAFFT